MYEKLNISAKLDTKIKNFLGRLLGALTGTFGHTKKSHVRVPLRPYC
jgi:hypothetical protein